MVVEIPTTVTDTEMNVCFTKYHSDTQKNCFYLSHNIKKWSKIILRMRKLNSACLQKALFTCLVYTNYNNCLIFKIYFGVNMIYDSTYLWQIIFFA